MDVVAKNICYTFTNYRNENGPTLVTAMISSEEAREVLKRLRELLPSIYMFHWLDTAIFGDFAHTKLDTHPDVVLNCHLHFYLNTR